MRSKSLVKGKAVAKEEEFAKSLRKGKAVAKEEHELLAKAKSEPGPEGITTFEWEKPFELEGIPAQLKDRMQALAPLLLGRDDAKYPPQFFVDAYRLSDTGPLPANVTESMVPKSCYEEVWPSGVGANKNRHFLEDCKDELAKAKYNNTYMKVYGEAPDNRAFSGSFLRACIYHFEHNKPVNWAGKAAALVEERYSHARLNPMKLRPPAIRYQLECILKEVATFLKQVDVGQVDGGGSASKSQQATGGNTKGSGTNNLDELLEEMQQKNVELERAANDISKRKKAMAQLDGKIFECESELERLQDDSTYLRNKSKDLLRAGKTEEKIANDREVRKIGAEIQANNDVWEQAELERSAAKEGLAVAEEKYKTMEDELALLQEQYNSEKASQASIKPKAPVGNAGLDAGVAPVLQLDEPCPRCQHKFVANTVCPLSCGCLFHPWCLWAVLLAGNRACPRCKQEVDNQWLEAWGFETLAPSKDSHGFMIKKREASCALEGEPAQKLAKLDPRPSLLLRKAEHNRLAPLPDPREYIYRYDCFKHRQRANLHNREREIGAIEQAVAYLRHYSMFLCSALALENACECLCTLSMRCC